MSNTIEFGQHAIILPPEGQRNPDDVNIFFVEEGSEHEKMYLFSVVFEDKYEYLCVVPLPDIDLNEVIDIDEIIEQYENHPEEFRNRIYEIARTYH